MEPTRNSGAGSGNSSTYSPEITETLRFQEEIQSLMRDNSLIHPGFESPPVNGSSFTALLGLPPNQAVELLHHPESGHPPAPIATALGGEMWRFRPTFPSNASLVDRAARFSVFAAEDSPEAASDSGDHSSPMPKAEPAESGDCPICPIAVEKTQRLTGKRKEGEKSKVKGPAKKSKSGEEKSTKPAEEHTVGDRLPYVHVRARRGQATDSHSLAERARREKINARMKLLQELVPGCSKISGTALVLEEIINHVQSLQRQVEFLSMRLAAVNPRIDFNGLDNILSAECGRLTAGNGRSAVGLEQSPWSDGTTNGGRRQQQQLWHVDLVQSDHQQQATVWERDDTNNHVFISPSGTSLFGYDSSANSVSLSNQLKTEL